MYAKALIAACGTVFSAGACGQSLTKQDMETLPVEVLAPKLLGEVGGLMIGVDRSNFPYDLQFFSKAHAPLTQYGLCAVDWLVVGLDRDGAEIRSVSAAPRFKVVDSIYQPSDEAHQKANKDMCSRLTNAEDFFPAPDWIAAKRIVSYVDQLKETGPFAGKKYEFRCTGSCNGIDGMSYVNSLELRNITAVSEIDCQENSHDDHCYKVELTGSPPGMFPRELRLYGRDSGMSSEVRKATLWIGQTFF